MEATAGNAAGNGSPHASQQQQGFQRQDSERTARIRIGSGSFAAADGDEDEDESMSNDESMSSSSSLEIDEAAASLHSDERQQQQLELGRDNRSESFDDLARQLPYQDGNGPRTPSFSFDVAEAGAPPLNGPPPAPSCMWLLTQFAPAMSKARHSVDPTADMEDDEPFDEESERARASAASDNHAEGNGNAAASQGADVSEQGGRSGNRRVAWGSSTARVDLPEGVRLAAARNEVTGVQLRLRSNLAFLLTTDTTNWLLAPGHGPRARVAVDTRFVPPNQLQVETFVVGCVEDENNDVVMETLERGGTSGRAAREHAVYVRLRVGEDLEPGVYELPVRVFTQEAGFRDEQLTWSSSFAVRVVDVRLPSPNNWRFRLDLWQHWTAVARGHRAALWSDRHFELIDRYMAPLAQMGQKCLSVVATEMPWAGQQCYMEERNASALFEHAVLEVYEDQEHGVPLTINFSYFDRLLELAAHHNLDDEIEVFGLLSVWRDPAAGFNAPAELTTKHLQAPPTASAPDPPPATALRRRSSSSMSAGGASTAPDASGNGNGAAGTNGSEQQQTATPPATPQTTSQSSAFVIDGWRIRCQDRSTQRVRYLRRVSEIESFIEQFYAHCVALGVADRVRVCADEPRDVAIFHEQLRFMERLAPTFRLKLAVNHSEFFSPAYAPPQVADYVPLLPLASADLEVTRRLANDARARNGHVSWYVCCGPAFPNQFVSSPLVEGELVGYLTFFFELDGFLRWNYCLWPARPWDDLRWRAPMWKVGDMYFVLPGLDGWPVETLRLESLRFAGQAFELLALAKDVLAPAQMQQLQRTVAEQILRSSDFEVFGRCADRAREDLYSLDPLDYQRAKTLILDTLAAAAAKGSAA